MARISSSMRRHPALSISFATVVALVMFTILVPLPYSSVVGYQAVISGPENGGQVPIASIDRALAALGYDQASVSFNTEGNSTSFTIDGLPSKKAAREAAAVFSTLAGYEGSVDYRPIVKRVSGTLLAQVQDKYFRVEVDASGKTDAEIAAEIASKLEAQGLEAPHVTVTTNPNGFKQLSIEATAGATSGEDSQTVEIQMTDGQN